MAATHNTHTHTKKNTEKFSILPQIVLKELWSSEDDSVSESFSRMASSSHDTALPWK